MKKIINVLLVFAFASFTFAADVKATVELSTDIAKLSVGDIHNAEFFTPINYADVQLGFSVNSDMFGASLNIKVDAATTNDSFSIKMNATDAWVKLGSLFKITIGDFKSRATNSLTGVVDEYELGILRWGASGITGGNSIEGDMLQNFVVDFYAGSTTLSFGVYPCTSKGVAAGTHILETPHLNLDARATSTIGDFANSTLTIRYTSDDFKLGTPVTEQENKRERLTIGSFVVFSSLVTNLELLAGYTASIVDWNELESGIDLRAEMPLGSLTLATHNNLSLYRDKFDENEMVAYNEVKGKLSLTDVMAISLAARSEYRRNDTSDEYDIGLNFGFNYTVSDDAKISSGLKVNNINGNANNIKITVPFTLEIEF